MQVKITDNFASIALLTGIKYVHPSIAQEEVPQDKVFCCKEGETIYSGNVGDTFTVPDAIAQQLEYILEEVV